MLHPLLALLVVAAPADTTKPIKFVADLGVVSTSGNTEVTTFNVAEKLDVLAHGWKFGQTFSVIYGRTDDSTTSSLWVAGVRGDRDLSPRVSLFVMGNFDRNRFAGIRARWSPQLGVAAKLVDGERDKLRLEVGGGYTWQYAVAPGVDQEFAGGRGALFYDRALGPKAKFAQMLEFLPNLKTGKDLRINSETSVTAPITAGIAMRAGYVVRYDGLPEAGFRKTDRILTTGVQLAF